MFFESYIVRQTQASSGPSLLAKTQQLRAGESYRLIIQIIHGMSTTSRTFEIGDDHAWISVYPLTVESDGVANEPMWFAHATREVSLVDAANRELAFDFAVSETTSASALQILILLRYGSTLESAAVNVGEPSATIISGHLAEPHGGKASDGHYADRPLFEIPATRDLPAHFASLTVERQYSGDGERVFFLQGACGSATLPGHTVKLPASLLPSLMKAKRPPREILQQTTVEIELDKYKLFRWLKSLFASHGAKLTLKIIENGSADFFWELLPIGSGERLGSGATVAHWFPIELFDTLRAEPENEVHPQIGHVHPYLAADENPYLEEEELRKLNPDVGTDADDFLDHLHIISGLPHHNVAVLYLGCHGQFTVSDTAFPEEDLTPMISLGSISDTVGASIGMLELYQLGAFQRRAPLAFVNACHSGRLAGRQKGIAQVMLAYIADSLIGTLGPVGVTFAGGLGRDFLLAASQPGGVRPAEFLRDRRREVLRQYLAADNDNSKSETEKHLAALNVLYAFSYIYFGNPSMTIALERVGEKEA